MTFKGYFVYCRSQGGQQTFFWGVVRSPKMMTNEDKRAKRNETESSSSYPYVNNLAASVQNVYDVPM